MTIKYLLLNPSNVFTTIIEQARSVIFAGGTMEPVSDFVQEV
jgi:chromosome transmission fidelity protein 1